MVQIATPTTSWIDEEVAIGEVARHALLESIEGAFRFRIVATALGPGARAALGDAHEQVAYVVRGEGVHTSAVSAGLTLTPAEGTFTTGLTGQEVRNTGSGTLLVLTVAVDGAGAERPTVTKVAVGGRTSTRLTADRGFRGLAADWLVNTDDVGSRSVCSTDGIFQPEGHHLVHRHPRAGEYMILLSGGGGHLTEHGELPVEAGDVTYVTALEWHGYRSGPEATHVFAGEIGVGRSTDGGYELLRPVES